MNVRIVPFEPWHLLTIEVQPEQRINDQTLKDEANARELCAAGPAFSVLANDGSPIAILGIVGRGPGRAVGWAVMAPAAFARFRLIHRGVKRFLELHDLRRLEIVVDKRHAASVRWALRLGFVHEGTMRSYAPDGSDMELYARVRDGL